MRRELMRGLRRLNATTTVLQRARLSDPLVGMWEAADVQWWWRRPRATDELALPVWFDEVGPAAAAGLTAWDDTWQADVFAVPSIVKEEDVWFATLEATADIWARRSVCSCVRTTRCWRTSPPTVDSR